MGILQESVEREKMISEDGHRGKSSSGCRSLALVLTFALGAITIAESIRVRFSPTSEEMGLGEVLRAAVFVVPGLLVVIISCLHILLTDPKSPLWSRVLWSCLGGTSIVCLIMLLLH